MNTLKKQQLLLIFLLFISPTILARFVYESGQWRLALSGSDKIESFFGKNISFFNNDDPDDKIFYSRHTLDINFDLQYGLESFAEELITGRASIRNKAVWGNPDSILKTSESTIKALEVVFGEHSHPVPRHVFWLREGWISFDIGTAFNLDFVNEQSLTLGAFPYGLGNGISLGDAYAVGPEPLGFYTDSAVDQFAYGALWSSELITNKLTHELYAAVLRNKSGSTSDTNAKILGQEYGRLATPERGFGKINFIITGRLMADIIDSPDFGSLYFEPYWLFNRDPEQFVEFPADAESKLGTIGLYTDYAIRNFELNVEWAFNMGKQKVKGWDRNQIILENRDGTVSIVNSHVFDGDPANGAKRLLYTPKGANQDLVNKAFRAESQNEQSIGIGTSGNELINANNRFRDPFNNVFKGWMAISEFAYWCCNETVRFAGTAGITSGEAALTPTKGTYDGFVPLQEIYSGNRVKSSFFLGGAGRVQRPLSIQPDNANPDQFENSPVSGFTNLMLVGGSVLWEPADFGRPFRLHPNVIAFWQEEPTGNARPFLGVEGNLFLNYGMFENMDLFFVGSFFVPGSFYTDRKGTVILTQAQEDEIEAGDTTGFTADPIPGLNDNVGFALNCGIKLSF